MPDNENTIRTHGELIDWIDAVNSYEEKPEKLYTVEDAAADIAGWTEFYESAGEENPLRYITPYMYMNAMNYCITVLWYSNKASV